MKRITIILFLVCVFGGAGCSSVMLNSTPQEAEVYNQYGNMLGTTPVNLGPVNNPQRFDVKKQGFVPKTVTVDRTSPNDVYVTLEQEAPKPVEEISATTLLEVVPGDKGLQVRSTTVHSEKDVIERSPNVKAVQRLTDFPSVRQVGQFRLFPDGRKMVMEILDQEITDEGPKQFSKKTSAGFPVACHGAEGAP